MTFVLFFMSIHCCYYCWYYLHFHINTLVVSQFLHKKKLNLATALFSGHWCSNQQIATISPKQSSCIEGRHFGEEPFCSCAFRCAGYIAVYMRLFFLLSVLRPWDLRQWNRMTCETAWSIALLISKQQDTCMNIMFIFGKKKSQTPAVHVVQPVYIIFQRKEKYNLYT